MTDDKKKHEEKDDQDEIFALTGHTNPDLPDEIYTLTGHPSKLKYADGGAVPPMSQMMTSLNQTPPTDYSFYKDISAEDRAKLAQSLMQKQHSGGNLIASGLAGLGDAISNSYGGKTGAHAQQDVEANAQRGTDTQLNAFDTQRSQRLQDMQGNQERIMNDPTHPTAQAMRTWLGEATGTKVPSGMNANVMLKVLGPLGELSYKQAMMGMTGAKQKEEVAAKKAEIKQNAAKAYENRGTFQQIRDAISTSPGTKVLKDQMNDTETTPDHGVPDLGSTFNGGKVLKVTKVK